MNGMLAFLGACSLLFASKCTHALQVSTPPVDDEVMDFELTNEGQESFAGEMQFEGLDSEGRALLKNFTQISTEAVEFYHGAEDNTLGDPWSTRLPEAVLEHAPLSWLHFPKTGSSFLNTLINVPGVCPGLPWNTVLTKDKYGGKFLNGFAQAFDIAKVCPQLEDDGFGHRGIGDSNYVQRFSKKPRLVTFFRQPEQRIISAYHDWLHAKSQTPTKLGFANWHEPGASWAGNTRYPPRNLKVFARNLGGCAVRMMTRGGLPCGELDKPTETDVQMAIHRLRTDFAFVGITDQWDNSICLFSKMFNTTCHSYQFYNTRPGVLANKKDYETKGLQGFKDKWDEPLYEEALKIFNRNLISYNVNSQTCQECFNVKQQ